MPRNETAQAVTMVSKFMDDIMSAEERIEFINLLKKNTSFCWDCGYSFGVNRPSICYCNNDD